MPNEKLLPPPPPRQLPVTAEDIELLERLTLSVRLNTFEQHALDRVLRQVRIR